MSTKEEVKEKYETWVATQSQEVKDLLSERFQALENTVKATRSERDMFSSELKELSTKIEKGSEADTKLAEMTNKLAQLERKNLFLEKAGTEGCLRPNVAYSVANTDNLYTEKGEPDWQKIRETVPELFKAQNTKANAGAGTKQSPVMNDDNMAFRQALKH